MADFEVIIVPSGQPDNSPAFQRRVKFGIVKVPQGRLNKSHVLRQRLFPLRLQHQGTPPPHHGGIARQNKMRAVEIGGVEDHVHILLSLPSTMAISKALQLIKGGSSKWIHENFPGHREFAWQEEYGAFSVSVSQLGKTIEYIKGQELHHRKMTFQEGFLALLKKQRIEYDERYLWK